MAQSDDATARSSSHAIIDEHATIRSLMDRVGETADTAGLCRVLTEFRAVAEPHFRGEEAADGFFESVLASSARHERELAALQKEHATFLAEMERLAELCGDDAGGDFGALRAGADELVERLRAHEATENTLLMEVLNTDFGAGD